MNRLLAFVSASALGIAACASMPTTAIAQITATVVSACGTPPGTYTAGQPRPVTQDTTGKLCDQGSGGGGSLSATASATPTPVVAGANKPLNIGLFSNLFVTGVDGSGNILDPAAATPAGENHIGEVGGSQIAIALTPTVTATTYTTGQVIGGKQTLLAAERVAGKGGLLQSAVLALKVANTVAVDIFFFNADPSGSTCTNASAFVLAAADIGKVVAVAHVTDWTAGNTASFGQSQNMAAPYVLPAGTSLWSCAVVRGSITTTSTSDLAQTANAIRN